MRILHVNYTFGVVGGTESYLHGLVGDLAARGHASEAAAEEDLTGGRVAPFHAVPEVSAYGERWIWRHGRRFRTLVRDVAPDVIHIHNTLNADLVRLCTRLRPTIRYVHDHTVFCPGLNKEFADGGLCDRAMGQGCIEKYHDGGCFCFRHPTERVAVKYLKIHERLLDAHRNVGKLMVASAYMRGELKRVGVAPDRIVVNPYYTAVPAASDDAGEEAPPLVLTLCRMEHPDKGVLPLLDALARIKAPFQARLVGTGKHLTMIRERAAKLDLGDRVAFPGFVPHDDALAQLQRARVVAFPSMWNEPFGIVGIEAMARGKPVVAFDVGGVREWLADGETGTVVPRGDVKAFASALEALLADRDQARALGAAGPARVAERFVKDRHLDVLTGVYAGVAGRGP